MQQKRQLIGQAKGDGILAPVTFETVPCADHCGGPLRKPSQPKERAAGVPHALATGHTDGEFGLLAQSP